jgi:uncharacterized damage-inducible protein DinB
MYRKIEDFVTEWSAHYHDTLKLLDRLTDASLAVEVDEGHRTLGRIAWHIVQTLPEMTEALELQVEGPASDAPVPGTAREIRDAYERAARSLLEQVQSQWSDATLVIEDQLYGETWKRGFTLSALICHEAHHRGQMTVLMRQAGLAVPGIFGPSMEEWANMGMSPPVV